MDIDQESTEPRPETLFPPLLREYEFKEKEALLNTKYNLTNKLVWQLTA